MLTFLQLMWREIHIFSLRTVTQLLQIQQLSPDVEHVCVNTLQMECDSSAMSLDERDQCRIMARRLKNRERQRRYRARRRLEADMKKARLVNESTLTSLTVDIQSNGININHVNQVHCQRNWKEDARRAHATKEAELTLTEHQYPPELTMAEPQFPVLDHGNEHQRCNSATKEPELTSGDPQHPPPALTLAEPQCPVPDHGNEQQTHVSPAKDARSADASTELELTSAVPQYPLEMASTDHGNEQQTHVSPAKDARSADASTEPELTSAVPQYPPEIASTEHRYTILDHSSKHGTPISSAENVGKVDATKESELMLIKPQYPPELTSTQPQHPVLDHASEDQADKSPAEDARSTHSTSEPELLAETDGQSEHLVTSNGCETSENTHGRRDWKEDARNKVD